MENLYKSHVTPITTYHLNKFSQYSNKYLNYKS